MSPPVLPHFPVSLIDLASPQPSAPCPPSSPALGLSGLSSSTSSSSSSSSSSTLAASTSSSSSSSTLAASNVGARGPWHVLALATFMVFTTASDIIGNVLVIVAVMRNKRLRNAGNMFVVSLAVADLVVALYPYPVVVHAILHGGWTLGDHHCQASGFLMGLSVVGSIFNITAIALNRCCFVCSSAAFYRRAYGGSRSACHVAAVWALALAATLPTLPARSLRYDGRVYACTFAQGASPAYTLAVVVLHFLLPVAVVSACYLRIWVVVAKVRQRVKPEAARHLQRHDRRNFLAMFVAFTLFAVCWAPLNLIGLVSAASPATGLASVAGPVPSPVADWLFTTSYLMAYFNSCLNAVVYGVLNGNFRREYGRIASAVCPGWEILRRALCRSFSTSSSSSDRGGGGGGVGGSGGGGNGEKGGGACCGTLSGSVQRRTGKEDEEEEEDDVGGAVEEVEREEEVKRVEVEEVEEEGEEEEAPAVFRPS
ncbi:melatonin receptor type 1B-A-like [Petromyzon marinus]|uniref:melatonin receptor type 1B-A-like n=1 Tax=Petromyzon marinus TaxID=7757 RepID=UPI003F6ED6EE